MHISKRDAPAGGGSNSAGAGVSELRMASTTATNIDLIARVFKEFRKNACLPSDDRISESFIKAGRMLLGASQAATTDAARDVLAERVRQTTVEGLTPDHDDEHSNFEMALAASYYAIHTAAAVLPEPSGNAPSKRYNMFQHADAVWPWAVTWRKPTDSRRNLVKAGALILAEIERLDRAASAPVSDIAVQMYMERHLVTEAEAKTFFATPPANAQAASGLSVDQIADIAGGCMVTAQYNMFMTLIRHASRERP
ncbi:hypothetical protein [Caballeronia sp. dw_19]|uniref:hypothetical protein n=1 Tax=Caballeronia sp. dw_19 TaxID=2719791 RepID=UPI001BCCA412|nr:hypothetical protein [Caballeronia sp. dw_19]